VLDQLEAVDVRSTCTVKVPSQEGEDKLFEVNHTPSKVAKKSPMPSTG
jgi:hypothetical protein